MKYLVVFLFLVLVLPLKAQSYFQQRVDYNIAVQLFDKENMLRGFEAFKYTNNSPEELDFIYVHLWPNAYKNNETALAKQLKSMGNKNLAEASSEEIGFIDSLDFKVNGIAVEWVYDSVHIDICKLILPKPLKPGESMLVETPFRVKIPSGSISRLGFVEESYQITQWYPKPAVFDKDGWHQMPYLTQGEFYSEYGSFDVKITLPKNYVVGATGDLQTASEIDFLNAKAKLTEEKYADASISANSGKRSTKFPPSNDTLKTIRYTQDNVHDFGWFADKRFEVLKGEVQLPNSNRKVTSWSMFVPHHAELWENSIEYLNDAIYYYSKWNGNYPYNQVTVVDGTISAGGGMEYPNVTVIGNSSSKMELEVVIVHEVGHNWFYGLLGSNERDHAWMDEGLNTMNEIRYMQTKYPNNKRMSDMANGIVAKLHFDHLNHHDMADLTYQFTAGYGLDQPIELHSADFTSLNYGAIVYSKTGLVFTYLKDYLGDELYDQAMQTYYDKWHYKHPQPEDIKQVLEEVSGKDLHWLFHDLIETTHQIDYKIQSVKRKGGKSIVKVRNTGQVNGPIRVDALRQNEIVDSVWLEPGDKMKEAVFDATDYDQIVIDYNQQIPDLNRNNNYWTRKGLFKRVEPLKMEFLGGDNEPNRWNSYWLPILGGNVYDDFMIGLMFHNTTIPKNKLEYALAPMYSFGRNNLAGFANIKYSWVPKQNFKMISVGVRGKTFGNGLNALSTEAITKPTTYYAIQPFIDLMIGKPIVKKTYRQKVSVLGGYISEQGNGISNELFAGFATYGLSYAKERHAASFQVRTDYFNAENGYNWAVSTSEVLNASLEGQYGFTYLKKKRKQIALRLFYGQNLFSNGVESSRYGFALGGQTGTQDAHYEQYMLGRNRSSGIWSNQRIENQGGFKTNAIQVANQSLFTANMIVDLPVLPFVVAYADYGMFPAESNNYESVYDAGLGLRLGEVFSIYFPLYESQSLKDIFPAGVDYGDKIRFTLKLNQLSTDQLLGRFL